MMDEKTKNLLLGIGLIVAGIMVLGGATSTALLALLYIGALTAVVVGIVFLAQKRDQRQNLAITLLVIGAVVLLVPTIAGTLVTVLGIILGIGLVLAGAYVLVSKT